MKNDLPLDVPSQHLIHRVLQMARDHGLQDAREAVLALERAMLVQGERSIKTKTVLSLNDLEEMIKREYRFYRILRKLTPPWWFIFLELGFLIFLMIIKGIL